MRFICLKFLYVFFFIVLFTHMLDCLLNTLTP
ncbi:Uncharacterised protein [Vibrio cholerae]|nr:Uncharacterised protein [Vibrio cholerae]